MTTTIFSTIINRFLPRQQQPTWQRAEQLAADFLQQQGLTILRRNYRSPDKSGEIDIIALEKTSHSIVFIEVRQRSQPGYGGAAASISATKQRKIIRAAQQYLQRQQAASYNSRFDAIVINSSVNNPKAGTALKIEWLKAAFSN